MKELFIHMQGQKCFQIMKYLIYACSEMLLTIKNASDHLWIPYARRLTILTVWLIHSVITNIPQLPYEHATDIFHYDRPIRGLLPSTVD